VGHFETAALVSVVKTKRNLHSPVSMIGGRHTSWRAYVRWSGRPANVMVNMCGMQLTGICLQLAIGQRHVVLLQNMAMVTHALA